MENVLLVTENSSYLVMSLKNKLDEAGYNVITSSINTDELSRIKTEIHAIFVFGDEDLVEDKQGMIYLKDMATEGDAPVFLSGDSGEIGLMKNNIPQFLIQKEYARPININEVAKDIDHYIITEGKQNKKKILVVDDSGAMLRNVKGWLEEKYQVILANSGAMAIKYLATSRPDLVLLDYEMPVVDGKQVLEMIRSESEFADIPVIFLTSKGDKKSVIEVMTLKPDGYLLKTMPPQEIKQSIDDFFEKRKAQRR